MERKLILVTGGSGFVGGRLIQHLHSLGFAVRALARTPKASQSVQALGAEAVLGDLQDRAALQSAAEGCQAVLHVAALFKLWGKAEEFERVNVEGTRNLLQAAASTSTVTRFVQVGAAAVVMGDPQPMVLANELLTRQERRWAPYSASKARSEALVLGANQPGRFETLVVRPPMIWGQGMPTLDQMVARIHSGHFRWPGDGNQAMSTVHVDNVCHAAALALEAGNGGQAYFISDGRDSTLHQVISGLLSTRGIAVPRASVSLPAAWFFAGILELAWSLFSLSGEPPITRQMLRLIGQPFTVDISKARRELGYMPIVSWDQGLAAMQGFNSVGPG